MNKNSKKTAFSLALLSLIMLSSSKLINTANAKDTIFPNYELPGEINDFPKDHKKQAKMLNQWNLTMDAFTQMGITGNPWSNENDYPRDNYIDPLVTKPAGDIVIQPITWSAFPNRINWYFSTSQNNPYQVSKELLYPLADEGRLNPDGLVMKKWLNYISTKSGNKDLDKELKTLIEKYPAFNSKDPFSFAHLQIPSDICPIVNWNQDQKDWIDYSPKGPRGWKDEYNEWVVTRDKEGKITKISFTAENPEYWFVLWRTDPKKVLELYHELVNEKVKLEDLYLTDKDGKYVKDYRDKYVYNPLNKWNYGNTATNFAGGAAHLTSPPNTLGAEVYLGAAATMLRTLPNTNYSPQALICVSQYGQNFRNSDPNIGFQVNQIVKNIGVSATLANPVALYMQYPDFSNYKTPDGTDASEFFTIVRGKQAIDTNHKKYDEILHATFEVPKEKGYTVSDITIAGEQIWWGSQIAETFNQALAGQAYTKIPQKDSIPRPAVTENDDPNAWAQPLVKYAVLQAIADQPALENATYPLIPPIVEAGTKLTDMGLEAISGAKDATIVYTKPDGTPEPNIKVKIKKAIPQGDDHVTGKSQIFETIIYVIDIEIGKDVKAGSYGVQITNQGNEPQVPTPANLIVTKGGN